MLHLTESTSYFWSLFKRSPFFVFTQPLFFCYNMDDQVTTQLSGENYGTAGPWYPLRKWRSSQDAGLLPLLESGVPRRMDWLQRSLAACYWPGYSPAPLFVPYISGSLHHPGPGTSPEQYKWRVSLDVAHFCPSEISLSVKDGFLQVRGTHDTTDLELL